MDNKKICDCIFPRDRTINTSRNGRSKHLLFFRYSAMVSRCYRENHKFYPSYGGRNILVCDPWLVDPVNFYLDMGDSFQEGLSIERIDNDRGYCKHNCKWASKLEQIHNRRNSKSSNKGISIKNGKFSVYINPNRKHIHLGTYSSLEEATAIRNETYLEWYGELFNVENETAKLLLGSE